MMALLLLLFAPDCHALGAPDWRDREAATTRLRSAGLVALPAIRRGQHSPDCEVRQRCDQLARRFDRQETTLLLLGNDLAAMLWVTDPRGGWVNEEDAAWFADGRYEAFDRLMQFYKWAPVGYRTPWNDGPISRVEFVMGVANFCRSQWRHSQAIPWPRPWEQCVRPNEQFPPER